MVSQLHGTAQSGTGLAVAGWSGETPRLAAAEAAERAKRSGKIWYIVPVRSHCGAAGNVVRRKSA